MEGRVLGRFFATLRMTEGLPAAYFVHLAARTVCLLLSYRREILSKN